MKILPQEYVQIFDEITVSVKFNEKKMQGMFCRGVTVGELVSSDSNELHLKKIPNLYNTDLLERLLSNLYNFKFNN